jgi:hypothetical protein
VWGRNDPLILPAVAEFVKQVVPAADLRYFDASHFALDENPTRSPRRSSERSPDRADA